jgi:hypothetical protein
MSTVVKKTAIVCALITLVFFNAGIFGVGAKLSTQKTQTQSGILFKLKSGARKLYDCIRGNVETCSLNEILAVRAVCIVLISKGITGPLFTEWNKRAIRVAIARRGASKISVDGEKEKSCCICLEEGVEGLGDIPCKGTQEHATQICYDCLGRLITSRLACPACRASM